MTWPDNPSDRPVDTTRWMPDLHAGIHHPCYADRRPKSNSPDRTPDRKATHSSLVNTSTGPAPRSFESRTAALPPSRYATSTQFPWVLYDALRNSAVDEISVAMTVTPLNPASASRMLAGGSLHHRYGNQPEHDLYTSPVLAEPQSARRPNAMLAASSFWSGRTRGRTSPNLPTGGQGLYLDVHDAFSLGWKLRRRAEQHPGADGTDVHRSAGRRRGWQDGAMAASNRRDLGRVFNEVPELYDRVRPGYPENCSPTWPPSLEWTRRR